MKGKIVFRIGVERVFDIEGFTVAEFRDLVEFVPPGIWKFLLYLHIVIVLHDKDKIRLLQDL